MCAWTCVTKAFSRSVPVTHFTAPATIRWLTLVMMCSAWLAHVRTIKKCVSACPGHLRASEYDTQCASTRTAPSMTLGLSSASHANWLVGSGGGGGVGGGDGRGGLGGGTNASSGRASRASITDCCSWWAMGCDAACLARTCSGGTPGSTL